MEEEKGRAGKDFWDTVKVILLILLIGILIGGTLLVLTGGKKFLDELAYRSIASALVNIIVLAGAFFLFYIFTWRWKRKNAADMNTYDGVLQCALGNYLLPAGAFLVFLMFLVMCAVHFDEFLEILKEGELRVQLAMPFGFALIAVYSLYYFDTKRVFYSDYELKLVNPFRKSRIIRWTQVKKIMVKEKKSQASQMPKYRLIFVTDDGNYTVRTDILSNGQKEFLDVMLERKKQLGFPMIRG